MAIAAVFAVTSDSAFGYRVSEFVKRRISFPHFTVEEYDYFRLIDAAPKNPTTMALGPDDRLYVAELEGVIHAYSIDRNLFGYNVVSDEIIAVVSEIPNHDDSGRPRADVKGRLVTGIERCNLVTIVAEKDIESAAQEVRWPIFRIDIDHMDLAAVIS